METKEYTYSTRSVTAKPRSKRLKGLGLVANLVTESGTGGSAAVTDVNSHTHANKTSLDKITVDADGYIYVTVTTAAADGTSKTETIKSKVGIADLATLATTAANLTKDSGDWATIKTLISRAIDALSFRYLSKVSADTAAEVITFAKGLLLGAGNYGLSADGNATLSGVTSDNITNTGNIITDGLTVTGIAHFFKLIIDQIKAAGGAYVFTPADGIEVDDVVSDSDKHRLYWRATDGSGKTRTNMWEVGDQALCADFNEASGNKKYWHLVSGVSAASEAHIVNGVECQCNYIDLSVSVKWSDSNAIPTKGDNVVMLGHRLQTGETDTARQSAIYISAYKALDTGLIAPLFATYQGIDDFNLASHRKTYIDAVKSSFVGNFTIIDADGNEKDAAQLITQVTASLDGLSTSVSKVTSEGAAMNTKLTQTATAISTEVSRATTAEGTLDSKITQTAEAISLKVETAGGRKNLIAGTAFRRQEEFAWNGRSVDCNIVCNAYVGTNAIYVNSTTTAEVSSGVAFNNISCKSSTSYRLTVLTKTPALSSFTCSTSYAVAVVRLYNSTGAMTQQIPCSIKPDANDTWKTNKTIFTTASDTVSLSVLLYVSNDGKLYICRPMLEESSTPDSGWTLGVSDYSYIGGNMLAGSRALDAGMEKDGIITVAGYGDKAVIYKDNSSGTTWSNVLQYTLTGAIESNMDYMLSLWVKGSGKVQLYLYNGSVTKQTEDSEGWSDTAPDGNCDVALTMEWKRIWVHWRTLQTINSTVSVLTRCPSGSKLYVAGMKLEKGATVTEYCESSEDLISKSALLACGIDISARKILATTDNFVIQNQSGETTMTVDEDGNLATSGGAAFKGTVKATVFYNNVLTIGYGIGGTWTNGNMSVENADVLIFRYANWDNYPAYNITIPTATSVAGKILEIYNYAKKSDNVTRPVINLRTVDLKDGDFFNPASSSTDILNIQGCKSLRLISSPTNADGSVYEWLMVDMVNAD